MTTSIGKTLRLARLFDPDTGTSVMLPMDHANEEPDYLELEHPIDLIGSLAKAGVNAFLFRRGLAAYAASAFAPAGLARAVTAVIRQEATVDAALQLLAASPA
ncbi:MAG TPA: hypothetical protein VHJ18_00540 [Streptosporangiaceae bacterium]|jgi:DhnA family fructose-bisphosphate aldolase class Ia|nr:hypothetical protein [Streptosporangiaceae bacterium]